MSVNQTVFNIVMQHLRTQGSRSINGTKCAYRSLDGLKCAIGALIPDDAYYPELEAYGVSRGNDKLIEAIPKQYRADESLLCALQSLHDEPKYWTDGFNSKGEAQAARIARSCDLQYQAPKRK